MLPEYKPERNLWCAVLKQFLDDARTQLTKEEIRLLIRSAQSDYIESICYALDINHKQFLHALYKTLEEHQRKLNEHTERKIKGSKSRS